MRICRSLRNVPNRTPRQGNTILVAGGIPEPGNRFPDKSQVETSDVDEDKDHEIRNECIESSANPRMFNRKRKPCPATKMHPICTPSFSSQI